MSNQLRDILEDKTIESSEVFDLARNQYQACMDTKKLEEEAEGVAEEGVVGGSLPIFAWGEIHHNVVTSRR